MTQDGFGRHKSQHWTWFYKWIYGTKESPITQATQIKRYSPCSYGLYHSQVGPDVIGGDFFENVETYAQREARAAAEEAARLQAEAEAAAKAAQEAAQAQRKIILYTAAGFLALCCILILIFVLRRKSRAAK